MTDRIPVEPDVKQLLREYADGLGTTYNDALKFVMSQIIKEGETPKQAGHRQRGEFDPSIMENGE